MAYDESHIGNSLYSTEYQCPHCGSYDSDYDGYCIHCGEKVVDYEPEQAAKPIKAKRQNKSHKQNDNKRNTLIGIGVIALILFSCGTLLFGGGKENDEQKSSSAESVKVEEQVKTETATQEASSIEPTKEQVSDNQGKNTDPEIAYMAAKILIGSSLDESIGSDNYTINYDKDGITVNAWLDGITQGAVLLKSGLGSDELQQSWDNMKSSTMNACSKWVDGLKESGVENPVVVYNVVNDVNHDNILLSVLNGVVIYDATKE